MAENPCKKYEKKSDEALNKLLLEGKILGWGTTDGKKKVLCLEEFDGVLRAADAQEQLPPEVKYGLSFFADEARPGTGIVAVRDGREVGPDGALGLFLAERRDPGEVWFLASGHVLMNFEWDQPYPDAFRSRQGLTAGDRRRKLGTVRFAQKVYDSRDTGQEDPKKWNVIDAGLVKLDAVEWKQKTTCYGEIGAPKPATPKQVVRKCGPEEPISTFGMVRGTDWRIRVAYKKKIYLFRNQILVQSDAGADQRAPFALPGDSGSLVVDAADRRPIGLLMAGSVRKNYYFLNPIQALQEFWGKEDLVQVRIASQAEERDQANALQNGAAQPAGPAGLGRDRPGARSGKGRGTEPEVLAAAAGEEDLQPK